MGGCFSWLILAAAFVFVMASLLRWFEQTTEAVDTGDWNKLTILVVFPFMVWRYQSKVVAGRPVPVPHHEPVKGFGGLPKGGIAGPPVAREPEPEPKVTPPRPVTVFPEGGPPPGTPKEFLGMPVIPPKKPKTKPAVDPDKMAKLRQKMIEQGMIKPPEEKKEE